MNAEEYKIIGGRKDFFALLALLAISMVAWFAHQQSLQSNESRKYSVTIFTSPEQKMFFNEIPHKKLLVTGKLGPAEIEWDAHGKVRIASSTCPCQTCINMGWTADASLICVPNGIVVEAIPVKQSFDAVTR